MDGTIFGAAVVATVVALAWGAIARFGILEERRRGSTPLWAYPFVPVSLLLVLVLVLAVEGEGSPFLTSLSSILIGMLGGACLAYVGLRALLSVWARWTGGPRGT